MAFCIYIFNYSGVCKKKYLKPKTMNKLFKDSETFQKERPLIITDKQESEVYNEVADYIIQWGLSKNSKKQIVKDLQEYHISNSESIETANELRENCNGYTFNSSLLEQIELIDILISEKKQENVKQWVEAHDIKPKYNIGDSFKLKKTVCYGYSNIDIVFITGIYKDRACYTISLDKNEKGGTLIRYERLHDCI